MLVKKGINGINFFINNSKMIKFLKANNKLVFHFYVKLNQL